MAAPKLTPLTAGSRSKACSLLCPTSQAILRGIKVPVRCLFYSPSGPCEGSEKVERGREVRIQKLAETVEIEVEVEVYVQ